MDEAMRHRLELRRSNAAQPHRNRYREAKIDPPWDEIHDYVWDGEDDE